MAIYMKYGKIDGDVTAAGHEKWIELHSLQWGVGRGISSPVGHSAERESSAPSISEVTITKDMDKASPILFGQACWGEGTKCELHLVKTDKGKLSTYMTYELTNTLISGYSVSSGGDKPTESLSLNFTKVEMKYIPHDAGTKGSGPVPAMYDLATGKGQ